MAIPFIKLCRSKLMEDVLDYPPAFIVLTHIALRARRDDTSYNPHGLKINQAFIGDVAKMKVTPREYRTAIKRLTEWRIIDKQATNKGTIVTLLLSDVFDINSEAGDKQIDKQATSRETSKRQLIKEGKKEEGNHVEGLEFADFWNAYNKKDGDKAKMTRQWNALTVEVRKHILAHLPAYRASKTVNGPQYMPLPQTFLNGKRWESEAFVQTDAGSPLPTPPAEVEMPENPTDLWGFNEPSANYSTASLN